LLQVVRLHQPGKILSLRIRELEHNLDLAISVDTDTRGILFWEEPVVLALQENGLAVGGLLLGNLFTSWKVAFAADSQGRKTRLTR
jgi:hypothetical protein